MNIEKALAGNYLFEHLNESELTNIARVGLVRTFYQNEHIFLEGDKGDSFYILLEGQVKLYKSGYDGRETVIRILKTGEMFAEVVCFANSNYPVNAISLTESRVLELNTKKIISLLNETPFRDKFIGNLFVKMRYLSDRLHFQSNLDVEERFFKFLNDQYGRMNIYEIDLSKKELAAAIGTLPETLSRLIARLKEREVITWDGHKLSVKPEAWKIYQDIL